MNVILYTLAWIAAIISVVMALVVLYKAISNKNGMKAVKCGHITSIKDKVSAFGETITTTLKKDSNGKVDYCHECLSNMVILCAWCKRPIFIGDPITLYSPQDEDYEIIKEARIYKQEPLTLVGCGRIDCAESGADYAGTWIPPGQVERTPTLIEQSIVDIQQGGTGIIIR